MSELYILLRELDAHGMSFPGGVPMRPRSNSGPRTAKKPREGVFGRIFTSACTESISGVLNKMFGIMLHHRLSTGNLVISASWGCRWHSKDAILMRACFREIDNESRSAETKELKSRSFSAVTGLETASCDLLRDSSLDIFG